MSDSNIITTPTDDELAKTLVMTINECISIARKLDWSKTDPMNRVNAMALSGILIRKIEEAGQ